ncbi:hypothetical protein CDAR_195061 [Caerostris darwini]|uniref:Uncharacterized protein n=1 Tax=Caerostris darwini TaxID=1538125 RepID=A0AAV4X7E4_9ARAC|nr:hypothetical protein CDAR_195061 [Caerostris darwini]
MIYADHPLSDIRNISARNTHVPFTSRLARSGLSSISVRGAEESGLNYQSLLIIASLHGSLGLIILSVPAEEAFVWVVDLKFPVLLSNTVPVIFYPSPLQTFSHRLSSPVAQKNATHKSAIPSPIRQLPPRIISAQHIIIITIIMMAFNSASTNQRAGRVG